MYTNILIKYVLLLVHEITETTEPLHVIDFAKKKLSKEIYKYKQKKT